MLPRILNLCIHYNKFTVHTSIKLCESSTRRICKKKTKTWSLEYEMFKIQFLNNARYLLPLWAVKCRKLKSIRYCRPLSFHSVVSCYGELTLKNKRLSYMKSDIDHRASNTCIGFSSRFFPLMFTVLLFISFIEVLVLCLKWSFLNIFFLLQQDQLTFDLTIMARHDS